MFEVKTSSTPTLSQFDPHQVPYQFQVIKDIRKNFDYGDDFGAHEVLLSGAVGSAKSILMAHIIVTHCLMYPGARAFIGRRALPDLKRTLFQKIIEHIGSDLKYGIDYHPVFSSPYIKFSNGSEIISGSWADKNYQKFRSLELSLAAFEELSENDEEDFTEAYVEISMRVNRLPHVPEQIIIAATNPDSPSHPIYKRFMETPSPTRHVYYSVTTDNKFLKPSYIRKLKEDLDPKLIERMIEGKWIDVKGETIYHRYDSSIHFHKNDDYCIDYRYPIHHTWDFNVGEGKPMSMCLFQYIHDEFHFFDEVVIDATNTEGTLDELEKRGHLSPFTKPDKNGNGGGRRIEYEVHGDATGAAMSANSNYSNYDLIFARMKALGLSFKKSILESNPPIKERHNRFNAYLKNFEGLVRVHLYKKCKILDEGCRLTKLKKGGEYKEDDSKKYQHVTTAAGYGIYYCYITIKRGVSRTVQL